MANALPGKNTGTRGKSHKLLLLRLRVGESETWRIHITADGQNSSPRELVLLEDLV
jgi:hypothetical protein